MEYIPYIHIDNTQNSSTIITGNYNKNGILESWNIKIDNKIDTIPVGGIMLDTFNSSYNNAFFSGDIFGMTYTNQIHNILLDWIKTSDTTRIKDYFLHLFSWNINVNEKSNVEISVIDGILTYKVSGNIYKNFAGIDTYYFQKSNHSILECPNCNNFFLKTSKNQKYCLSCSKEQQKIRLSANKPLKLRNKIKDRLNRRDFSFDYGYKITNSFDFSDIALEYKKNHTPEEYFSWLKEIDILTDRAKNSKLDNYMKTK